eukprot:gene19441-21368_t
MVLEALEDMKPDEDFCASYQTYNADYEILPLELIQDISVLVLEGRLPQFSANGRCEGKHCWPVSLDSKKKCCYDNTCSKTSMCNFVESVRSRMRSIWTESIPAFIEVLVSLDNLFPMEKSNSTEPCQLYLDYIPQCNSQHILLLERWKMDVHKIESNLTSPFVNIHMFLQAIRSFLHFSQLSAWLIKTGGRIPNRIFFRITHSEESSGLEFRSNPEIHVFPRALASKTEAIQLMLFSLPRLELASLISMSPYKDLAPTKYLCKKNFKKSICDDGESGRDKKLIDGESCGKSPDSFSGLCDSEETPTGKFASVEARRCDAVYIAEPPLQAKLKAVRQFHDDVSLSLKKRLVFDSPKRDGADHDGDWKFMAQKKKQNSLYASNCVEQKELGHREENLDIDHDGAVDFNGSEVNGNDVTGSDVTAGVLDGRKYRDLDGNTSIAPRHCKTFHIGDEDFNDDRNMAISYSESNGSQCNGFGSQCTAPDGDSSQCNGFTQSSHCEFAENGSSPVLRCAEAAKSESSCSEKADGHDGEICPNSRDPEVTSTTPVNHRKSQSYVGLNRLDKSTNDRLRRSESYCGMRPRPSSLAAKLSMGAATVPVFHPNTGLPVASSPAPLRRPDIGQDQETKKTLSPSVAIRKTRKLSTELSPHTKTLSRSAPASTRLLGNFEESVLKGRLPIFGTVEGFTAEIGASGSFCPPHITCPVKAHFFRTSDDNAPSPYLGHISLRNAKGKKGYHVPRNGTVQLTLFNPNNTVVKVFIVLYNFNDMPSNSHTFLRQKIVSVKIDPDTGVEQQTSHYLVHLRFASTRHDRIYLHTDIRLIFPQQSPDVTSSKLKIMTNGPLDPKYTPRDR